MGFKHFLNSIDNCLFKFGVFNIYSFSEVFIELINSLINTFNLNVDSSGQRFNEELGLFSGGLEILSSDIVVVRMSFLFLFFFAILSCSSVYISAAIEFGRALNWFYFSQWELKISGINETIILILISSSFFVAEFLSILLLSSVSHGWIFRVGKGWLRSISWKTFLSIRLAHLFGRLQIILDVFCLVHK